MNIIDDIKNVSETVLDKLAAQFTDLPKPLLAAIGAGDLAVERLGALREELAGKFGDAAADLGHRRSGDDVKQFAADLPGKAQKVATDIAHHLQEFASDAPDKAQQLIADLPAKAQEMANALSPDKLKSTVESYTQMVSMIFANLADRGGETVAKVRADDAAEPAPAKKAPAKPAAKPAAKKAPAKPTAKKAPAKPAAKKAPAKSAAKPAAAKPTVVQAEPAAPAAPAATTDTASDTAK